MANIVAVIRDMSRESVGMSLFIGLLLIVLFNVISAFMVFLIGGLLFDYSWADLSGILQMNLEDERALAAFRTLQGLNQVFTWGAAGLIMAYLLGGPSKQWGLKEPLTNMHWILTVVIILASIPLASALVFDPSQTYLPSFFSEWEEWSRLTELRAQEGLQKVILQNGYGILLINLFVFALVPAFCEEIFFRGFLQKTFQRVLPFHVAVWLSALIFSFIHFQFHGFLTRALLGGLLGYLFAGSKNLLPAVLGHFVYNAISIAAVYFAYQSGVVDDETAMQPINVPIIGVLFSLLIVIGLNYSYFKLPTTKNLHEQSA